MFVFHGFFRGTCNHIYYGEERNSIQFTKSGALNAYINMHLGGAFAKLSSLGACYSLPSQTHKTSKLNKINDSLHPCIQTCL